MTRDETIQLWQRCEQARASALAELDDADQAHAQAKALWNSWPLAPAEPKAGNAPNPELFPVLLPGLCRLP